MAVCMLFQQSFPCRCLKTFLRRIDASEVSPELRSINSFILFPSPHLCLLCSARFAARFAQLRCYAKLPPPPPPPPPGAYLDCNKCKCTYFENDALITMLINADATSK
jgi:hypothetical protein